MKTAWLLVGVVSVFSACAPAWQRHPVIASPSGVPMCAKHHRRLITVGGYAAPASYHSPLMDDSDYRYYLVTMYPNRVPVTQSLVRTEIATIPAKVTYCPV